MNVKDMKAEIASTSYPGRGILLGRSEDGKKAVIAYFIMGRSANSRNRVFEAMGDDLRTPHLTRARWKIRALSFTTLCVCSAIRRL